MLTKYSSIGWLELIYICMDIYVIYTCLVRLNAISHLPHKTRYILRRIGLLSLIGSCTCYVASYWTLTTPLIESSRQFFFMVGVVFFLSSTHHRYSHNSHTSILKEQS